MNLDVPGVAKIHIFGKLTNYALKECFPEEDKQEIFILHTDKCQIKFIWMFLRAFVLVEPVFSGVTSKFDDTFYSK